MASSSASSGFLGYVNIPIFQEAVSWGSTLGDEAPRLRGTTPMVFS
jgi:hypothetical protein